jgi:Rrf2 family protein
VLISSKSEYGLRALVDIARNSGNNGSKPVTRTDISGRQHIPLPYLTQVLRMLVGGGLLVSNRGPSGGYKLARTPEKITILDVVTVLQGPVSPAGCAGSRLEEDGCEHFSSCGLAGVWSDLKSANEEVLRHTTLGSIMNRGASLAGQPQKTASGSADEKLDCIGMSCPLPIVKITEKLRAMPAGRVLEVWADDEGTKADIPAWCMGTGNEFICREEFGNQMKFLIRKSC